MDEHNELRTRLRAVGIELFRRDGLRFTMQQAAAVMHISKKTIYAVYPSKEALLLDMVDDAFTRIHARKQRILDGPDTLAEKLLAVIIALPEEYTALDLQQMDLLDAWGIAYDDTPGVSSFCGAAAALNAEYTLPGVSQTVIITRMEGRTPVPEGEHLAALAAHGATMVIFLSIGLIDKVQAALLQGAYTAATPAAVVYKATWPEEKILRCTVGTLAAQTKAAGITKTALIVVGDFLAARYDRSCLYDPAFTTEYRRGTQP